MFRIFRVIYTSFKWDSNSLWTLGDCVKESLVTTIISGI